MRFKIDNKESDTDTCDLQSFEELVESSVSSANACKEIPCAKKYSSSWVASRRHFGSRYVEYGEHHIHSTKIKLVVDEDRDVRELVSFISESVRSDDHQKYMYKVYDVFSTWQSEDRPRKCDEFMQLLQEVDLDLRVNLSILMATFPLRAKLNYRSRFYDFAVKRALIDFTEDEVEQIFMGLK